MEWEEDSLKRVFHILERTMRDVEDINPFPSDKKGEVKKKEKVGKKKKKEESSQEESMDSDLTGIDLRLAETRTTTAVACMRAVECTLACLDSEGLSKPVSYVSPPGLMKLTYRRTLRTYFLFASLRPKLSCQM